MDAGYKIGALHAESGEQFLPSNHRILDGGHTVAESVSKAFEVGETKGYSTAETFAEWAKSYLVDLSSPAGMPLPFADNIYAALQHLGFSKETAADVVTVNGQEAIAALMGGTIAALALVLSWKNQDKERFSQTVGSLLTGSALCLNPAALVVAIVGLAIGYNKQVVSKEAMKRGSLVSMVGLGVSALIPGPVLLGAVPAFVIATYLNKKLDRNVPVAEQVKSWIEYLRSDEFKQLSKDTAASANNWLEAKVSEVKNAA